jgi:hypothetical protein
MFKVYNFHVPPIHPSLGDFQQVTQHASTSKFWSKFTYRFVWLSVLLHIYSCLGGVWSREKQPIPIASWNRIYIDLMGAWGIRLHQVRVWLEIEFIKSIVEQAFWSCWVLTYKASSMHHWPIYCSTIVHSEITPSHTANDLDQSTQFAPQHQWSWLLDLIEN